MDLLYSTGNSAPYYVAAWMGEEYGGEWIRVSLHVQHTCMVGTLLCISSYPNIVNQLYADIK